MKHIYLFFLSTLFLANTALKAQDLTVNAIVDAHHTGANTLNHFADFPADVSIYESITMNFNLTCPNGGCDPWDRFATIKVVSNGEDFEIGRYVTPYGNSWCGWSLDVSDYKELLSGNVELETYIETWSNGWMLDVSFDFYEGTPNYPYVAVQNLWVDYFFIYGDTIFYSLDLPSLNVNVPANAEDVKLRMVNTGHGQGNTDNAAEFSQRTHQIRVNGNTEFNQFLWKADCDVNTCSPQAGTWEFSRAGWCPGQEVTPDDYNLTSLVTPGETVNLDYVLESSFNECSPWNPTCDDGVTCNECNYNSGTHTQPNYKISAQLIVSSNTPVTITSVENRNNDNKVKIYPNPSPGQVNISYDLLNTEDALVTVLDLSGREVHKQTIAKANSGTNSLDLNNLPAGLYLIQLSTATFQTQQKIYINSHR